MANDDEKDHGPRGNLGQGRPGKYYKDSVTTVNGERITVRTGTIDRVLVEIEDKIYSLSPSDANCLSIMLDMAHKAILRRRD